MQQAIKLNMQSKNDQTSQPWQDLESGKVAWNDFSAADQEKIVRHFAPKIKYLALRLKARLPKSIELSELISAGTLGLMECLGKFQPQLCIFPQNYEGYPLLLVRYGRFCRCRPALCLCRWFRFSYRLWLFQVLCRANGV